MKTIFNILTLTCFIFPGKPVFAQDTIPSDTLMPVQTDTVILVNGVCHMCKHTIEQAAFIEGVSKAEWNVETKELVLRYDLAKVNLDQINLAINKSGYDTEFTAAKEEDYQKLNKCCHYRDPEVVNDHK